MWGDISLWFWFAFLWWLEMMSILPHACWPSVYFLWKNVFFRFSAPFLIGLFGFLILNCLSCLCILNINHCWSYNLTNAFSQLFDIQKIFLILVCNHDVHLVWLSWALLRYKKECKRQIETLWVFIRIQSVHQQNSSSLCTRGPWEKTWGLNTSILMCNLS